MSAVMYYLLKYAPPQEAVGGLAQTLQQYGGWGVSAVLFVGIGWLAVRYLKTIKEHAATVQTLHETCAGKIEALNAKHEADLKDQLGKYEVSIRELTEGLQDAARGKS